MEKTSAESHFSSLTVFLQTSFSLGSVRFMGFLKKVLGGGEADGRKKSRISFPKRKYGTRQRCLGKGVSGSVYLYKTEKPETFYAVKCFEKKNMKDPDEVASINKEIDIHSMINRGTHIVTLIDSFRVRTSSEYLVILEYLPFNLLDLYIKFGAMIPLLQRMCYYRQIVSGISFMHSRNIAHRDIKLENCCVDITGKLKIIDFGSSTIGETGYGMAGSPSYSAPEIHGSLKYNSFKSDIWSLGIVLINLFYVSKQKWNCCRYDDQMFVIYKEEPTILNAVRFFEKNNAGSDYLTQKPFVDDLIRQLLTVDVNRRITLPNLENNHWIKSVPFCHSDSDYHNHYQFLANV